MNFHQHRNRLLGLAGLAVVPVLVAGCGGVPGNAVATVDGTTITKKAYETAAKAALAGQDQSTNAADVVLPDAPNFTKCIADRRAKLPKPGKGQKPTPDATLKKQCADLSKQVRDQTMSQLVAKAWLTGEAKAQDVKVSDAEVNKQFDAAVKQELPQPGALEKYLKQTGTTKEDLLENVRAGLLQTKLQEKVTKDAGDVTDKEVADYYAKNKQQFGQPERRDLRVILTKTEAKAEEAKSAIENGTSFADAAKEYSIDPTSKAQGGKLEGVAKGQQEQALDKAVFSADEGELTGPVKSQFGSYVFEVTKTLPASQQSLEQSAATIKQTLQQQQSQKAVTDYFEKVQKEWRAKTECAAAYKTVMCDNGPKPTPTPSAAQQVPQGAQQAPQQTQQGG